MSKFEKLIQRIKSKPSDFTFDEAKTLLCALGYELLPSGKTGGSSVTFAKGSDYIRLHKPHPRILLKAYQVHDLIEALEERSLI